jgi:hypothetical protein
VVANQEERVMQRVADVNPRSVLLIAQQARAIDVERAQRLDVGGPRDREAPLLARADPDGDVEQLIGACQKMERIGC